MRNTVTGLVRRGRRRYGILFRYVTPRNGRLWRYAGYGNGVIGRNAAGLAGRGLLRRYVRSGEVAREGIGELRPLITTYW